MRTRVQKAKPKIEEARTSISIVLVNVVIHEAVNSVLFCTYSIICLAIWSIVR